MDADWYATLKISAEAPLLSRFDESARTYLPDGFAPAGAWGGAIPRIHLGRLADTLEWLQKAGPDDFYRGTMSDAIAADAWEQGARLTGEDLAQYEATVVPASSRAYRGATVHAAARLTAGPTLHRALELLEGQFDPPEPGSVPGAGAYCAYANSLAQAYEERLRTLGDTGEVGAVGAKVGSETCTTHLSVVDADGNLVALTQTLLSIFGSKVMFPNSGILMNNGIMWFDPRPGQPNSIGPGRRPLSNMCPTVVDRGDGVRFAAGASGGRRILPAVFQLASLLVDFGMDLETAAHWPRLDSSGELEVSIDRRVPRAVVEALARRHKTSIVTHGVYPALFACPNVILRDESAGLNHGVAYVPSPWSKVSAAEDF